MFCWPVVEGAVLFSPLELDFERSTKCELTAVEYISHDDLVSVPQCSNIN